MSDDLTRARGFLRRPPGMESVEGYAAAAAYAAVDAAETLRRIEALLHDKAQGASAPHDGAGYPGEGSRERGGAVGVAPDAPATPQVGEVWECRSPFRAGEASCSTVVEADSQGHVYMDKGNGPFMSSYRTYPEWWRRVSPAPAPLTEREVTAEAEAQGVEPASDEAAWEQEVRYWCQRALDAEARAEKAEAQVALMRPVVDAAQEYEETHPATEGHLSACRLVCPAVRAYREAPRDE